MSDKYLTGERLRYILDKEGMSMRQLAKSSNINVSTISRIINGRRKPTLSHLQRLSEVLHTSVQDLLGEEKVSLYENENIALQESFYTVQSTLGQVGNTHDLSIQEIEKELKKYIQFVQTEEGESTVLANYKDKRSKLGDFSGPYLQRLEEMFLRFSSKKGTTKQLILMGSALLYFIFTVDVIPDYLFPIGFIDDAIAINLVMGMLEKTQ